MVFIFSILYRKLARVGLTLIWRGSNFNVPPPPCWFNLNSSETVKVVTLAFGSIQ